MSTRQRCLAQGVLTPNWLKLKSFRASASERAKNIVLMAQRVPPHPPPNWLILKCERAKKITFYVVISGEYWKKFSPLARKPIKTSDSLIFNAGARAKKGHFFWVKMVRQPPGVASPRAPPELKIKTFRERAKRASEIFLGFWHWGNAAEAYLDQKLRKKRFFLILGLVRHIFGDNSSLDHNLCTNASSRVTKKSTLTNWAKNGTNRFVSSRWFQIYIVWPLLREKIFWPKNFLSVEI